jgi:hypothetical protein
MIKGGGGEQAPFREFVHYVLIAVINAAIAIIAWITNSMNL